MKADSGDRNKRQQVFRLQVDSGCLAAQVVS